LNARSAVLALTGAVLIHASTATAETSQQRCIAAAEATQRSLHDGKLLDARAEATSCSAPACPDVVRTDCERWLDEASTQIPTVVVTAHDGAGHDVVQARLEIDGSAVASAFDGRPIELDPGAHQIRVTAGTTTASETVVLASGERNRHVRLTLVSATKTDSAAHRGSSAPMWIAFGAAGAAGALATGFGIAALAKHGSLEGSCGHACPHAEVAAGERYALVADVALGTALVAAGLGLWFLFRHPRPEVRVPNGS